MSNNRQRRVGRRVGTFYDWFKKHPDQPITLAELCDIHQCQPGKLSSEAILDVRECAEADGWEFPPAVPANGQTYVLTHNPKFGIDPALHMGAIKLGVERREGRLTDFVIGDRDKLSPVDRPYADTFAAAAKFEAVTLAAADEFRRDMVTQGIASRRDLRQASADNGA